MGTSGSYGGPSPGSPLIPDFIDPIGSPPVGPDTPPPDPDGTPPPAIPAAPPPRAPIPPAPDDRRFSAARGNFTTFARSGGRDRKALGRAVGGYVATTTAGSRTAARRMASSRGPGDRVAVPASQDEKITKLDLVSGQQSLGHGVGTALSDLRKLKVYPTEIGLDLLVLAALVHAADTRISRMTESKDAWTREIRLVVPVSEPARWNHANPILIRILNFLTGDRWVVGFRARPRKFARTVVRDDAELIEPPFNNVNLFSGGLDSLIGAIDVLERGQTPLFVSHAGEGAVSKPQEDCFDALKANYKKYPLERLRVWMNFSKTLVRGVAPEETTRGRSFLFFALGVFAGTGLGRDFTLNVPENGLISLNVPLDTLRLGALSTRTTHQFYIARWNELLKALGVGGVIENPYWDKTKGEMAAECLNPQLLKTLIPHSMSCASPTKGRWQGHGTEHCGYCLPCLIRRAALKGVGDSTQYTVSDLRAQVMDTTRAQGQQIRSFQYAAARLKARPELARVLIHKPGPLYDHPDRSDALAEVYRRGLAEVGTLLQGVKARPN